MRLTKDQLKAHTALIVETKEWLESLGGLQPKHKEWLKWAIRRLRTLREHEVTTNED